MGSHGEIEVRSGDQLLTIEIEPFHLDHTQIELLAFLDEGLGISASEKPFTVIGAIDSAVIELSQQRCRCRVKVRRVLCRLCGLCDRLSDRREIIVESVRIDDLEGGIEQLLDLSDIQILYLSVTVGVDLDNRGLAVPEHHADEIISSPHLNDRAVEVVSLCLNHLYRKHDWNVVRHTTNDTRLVVKGADGDRSSVEQ